MNGYDPTVDSKYRVFRCPLAQDKNLTVWIICETIKKSTDERQMSTHFTAFVSTADWFPQYADGKELLHTRETLLNAILKNTENIHKMESFLRQMLQLIEEKEDKLKTLLLTINNKMSHLHNKLLDQHDGAYAETRMKEAKMKNKLLKDVRAKMWEMQRLEL